MPEKSGSRDQTRDLVCINIAFLFQRGYVFSESSPSRRSGERSRLLKEENQPIAERSMNPQGTCCDKKKEPVRACAYGLLCLGVMCMFVASACLPTLSTQKKETHGSSPALIKPTLQDPPTELPPKTPHRDTTPSASKETLQQEPAANSSIWRGVVGMIGSKPAAKPPADSAGLLKPILSDQPDSHKEGPPDAIEKEPPKTSDSRSGDSAGSDKRERSTDVRQSKKTPDSRSEKGFREFDRPIGDDSEIGLYANREKPRQDEFPEEGKGGRDTKSSPPSATKTDSFPKHDHSKYATAIRHKAIDMLNRQTDCDVARLCRDSLTEEWSLVLYFKTGPSYYYVMHAWDEIEGKWAQSFVSEKSPISGMKKHLAFSAAGKTCKVLKCIDRFD